MDKDHISVLTQGAVSNTRDRIACEFIIDHIQDPDHLYAMNAKRALLTKPTL